MPIITFYVQDILLSNIFFENNKYKKKLSSQVNLLCKRFQIDLRNEMNKINKKHKQNIIIIRIITIIF